MEQRQTISEISEHIALEMERLQYSPLTILDFRRKAKHLYAVFAGLVNTNCMGWWCGIVQRMQGSTEAGG